jgi:hypothetical protein
MPIAAISFFVGDAEPTLDRHPLRVIRVADSWMDELLRHIVGEGAAVAFGDDLQHHVERCGAAGTGTAIAIDDKNVGRCADPRKPFLKRCDAFPMQRTAPTIEQSGKGEHISAEADAANRCTIARETAQPFENRCVTCARISRSGTNQQHIEHDLIIYRPVHGNIDAIACAHRVAIV